AICTCAPTGSGASCSTNRTPPASVHLARVATFSPRTVTSTNRVPSDMGATLSQVRLTKDPQGHTFMRPMGVTDWLKERASEFVESRLGTDFRDRTQALAVRQNEYGFAPFGFHRDSLKYAVWVARFLYKSYFRCESHGFEQ